jgi:serine protease AprX
VPVLVSACTTRSFCDEREHVVVVFADTQVIPRFPEPATDEPRDSNRNQPLLERAQELVQSIGPERAPGYERLEAELADYEATMVERFWLINGVVADMPLKSVVKHRDQCVSACASVSWTSRTVTEAGSTL